MSQSIEEKNKALVLEAFETLLTDVITQRLSAIGRPTTFNTARHPARSRGPLQFGQKFAGDNEIRKRVDLGRRKPADVAWPVI